MEEDNKSSVAVAAVPVICLLGFRGNNRVIRTRDIPLVMSFLQFYDECDNNEFCLGCLIALMLLGLGSNKSVFRHIDMPAHHSGCSCGFEQLESIKLSGGILIQPRRNEKDCVFVAFSGYNHHPQKRQSPSTGSICNFL
jgi:hypothetical protein